MAKGEKGLSVKKSENISEWYTELVQKAELADYAPVKGFMVIRPNAYSIWEKIQEDFNKTLNKKGIKNSYFPLLIPDSFFKKEAEHAEGFAPELAYVKGTEEGELLAIRPTSETIMYDSYSKWIRSWRDLPLKLNQWNNVVRWEFKHPIPFLRTREFLWNEGHTVYATKDEAENEKDKIIGIYDEICRDFLALPSLIGKKTEKEKFAGAEYTVSMEFFMPNGKAIQGPDFHHDGQNFAKAYGIKFLDKKGKEDYAWQNTFAITTRMLGVLFAIHSDSKGLILPPMVAPEQIVIVPIFSESDKDKIIGKAKEVEKKLGKYRVVLDDREDYRPGFKFNEWELKGVPVRIEIGPKDVAADRVVLVRRDSGDKENVKISGIDKKVDNVLEEIQGDLLDEAEKLLKGAIVKAGKLDQVRKAVNGKKIALAPLCRKEECEDNLKYETGGAKVLNISEKESADGQKCVVCGKEADYMGYIGKSY